MADFDIEAFIGSLRYERSMAENTCTAYARDLRFFSQYLAKRGISAASSAGRDDIVGFLGDQRSKGRKSSTRARRATAIKMFFRFPQLMKAQGPIAVTESGRMMVLTLLPLKASSPV